MKEESWEYLENFNLSKVLQSVNNTSDRVPNITRDVDWVYIHCDLISRKVSGVGSDVLLHLAICYPFSKERKRLSLFPVQKQTIYSLRVCVNR